ncbi:unnamed protein product, partial [Sphenostylis stenocarpa]
MGDTCHVNSHPKSNASFGILWITFSESGLYKVPLNKLRIKVPKAKYLCLRSKGLYD